MASKIVQAFKQKDVRNKIIFALIIVFLYRLGTCLPIPGIPFHDMAEAVGDNGFLAALTLFSGGSATGVLALGIMPFITSSIILQLMGLVFPKVAEWKRSGAEGRKHIIKWTRILTLVLAIINAVGYDLMFQAQYGIVYPAGIPFIVNNLVVVFCLVIGALILMYLCEITKQVTGINGMSLIVLCSVCSSVPPAFVQAVQTSGDGLAGIGLAILAIVFIIIILPIIVEIERAQRRVPIKSTKSGANSMYARSQETNYIPVPINIAGLYSIIFTSAFLMLPVYLSAWFSDVQWLQQLASMLTSGWLNWILTGVLVIAFCFFMAGVNFNSEDIADNLKKQGSYVPGVRPGNATTKYFEYIVNHITLFGAIYVAIVAVGSSMLFYLTGSPLLSAFGGTSIFIMASSSIQIMTNIEQQIRAGDPEAVLRRLGR